MNNNIFIADSFDEKKKPVYQGVERNREIEKSYPAKKKKGKK